MDSSPLGLRLGAEALGTFLFFFLGFNAIAVSVDIGSGAISTLGIAFAFGLGLALAIAALGHISGGHFNPAVSLGLVSARKFPPKELVPYWMAQLVGGFVAVLVVAVVYSGRAVDALDTAPGARHLERGRAPAGADRDRPVRDRDLHRRDGRPRALERRHGAAADRALHLHRGGRDRSGVRWLVQPREIARPRALQLETSAISGSTSSGRSSGAWSAERSG